jgi:4-hydroxybenzoate polyprenyltransferase
MHWITMVGIFFTILCGVLGFVDGILKKGKLKTTFIMLTFFFAAFTISFVYNSDSF